MSNVHRVSDVICDADRLAGKGRDPHMSYWRIVCGLMDHITNVEMTCDTTFMLAWNQPREPAKML